MEQKGYIYKLYNNDKVYYGSTIDIPRRIRQHKTSQCCKSKIFQGDFEYEIIEELIFTDMKELRIKERYYIENNECINVNIPTRTSKEYHKDNKDFCVQLTKDWINNNPDRFKAIQKKSYDKCGLKRNEPIQCDCGGKYPQRNKKSHIETKKHKKYLESL